MPLYLSNMDNARNYILYTKPVAAHIHSGYWLRAMRNRLKEIREARGLSVKELATLVKSSAPKIYKLEDGTQRLTDYWLARLAPALGVAPEDLVASGPLSVPLRYHVAGAFSEGVDGFDLAEPHERIHPPKSVAHAEDCFAVQVRDNSADRLYPRGTVLVVRPLAFVKGGLKLGQKVLIKHYRGAKRDGEIMEVLVGYLDRAVTGELVVSLPTSNRQLPPSVRLKPAPRAAGLADRQAWMREDSDMPIHYVAGEDDPAEIVGTVVMSMMREE